MYIIKNAFRNMCRNKGKNILIGVIVTVVVICTCIGLAIHKAGTNLVNAYKTSNPLAVSFTLNMGNLKQASDDDKNNFNSLTVDDIKSYAESKLVKDYYYTLEASVNSTNISAVSNNERPNSDENNDGNENNGDNSHGDMKKMSMGDFKITAYSNFAYLSDFTDGTKKITSGEMVSGNSSEAEIVISESLAEENSLEVGSEVTLCLTDDESTTFTFKVVGIFSDSSDDDSTSVFQMSAMSASNQIYANIDSVQSILNAQGDDNTKLVAANGLSAKFYLTSNSQKTINKFYKYAQKKGLSDYYSVTTNEEEVLATLKPIQNISSFSMNFLIVILVIGAVVLTVINFLNIRDRKYEIGVLRAIGMSKWKVTSQLVLEIFFVALISLVIGTGIGFVSSQPITNKMLENEIESYTTQTQTTTENFGRSDMQKPSEAMGGSDSNNNGGGHGMFNFNNNSNKNVDYVSSLKVSIDIITIVELMGVVILLTVVSGSVASIIVNKYNPNRILQNRV